MKKENNYKIYFTIGIIVLVTAFMVFTVVGTKIVISDTEFTVTGIFGTKIPLEDVKEIKLLNNIPKAKRITGMDLLSISIGTYYIDGYGKTKYYVKENKLPYILIKGNDKTIIIGESPEKNIQYYNKLNVLLRGNQNEY